LVLGSTSLVLVAVGCDDESSTAPTGATATGTTTGTDTGTTTGTTTGTDTGTTTGTDTGTTTGTPSGGEGGSGQGGAGQGGETPFVFECGSGQGGGGGQSGGQGGGCVSCSGWLSGADPTTICDASCTVAEPLATCACIDECAGPCGASFCLGNAPSGGCTNCRTNNCSDELTACEADN
jgi:hypothetical protein